MAHQPELKIGEVILSGKYQVLEFLGEGNVSQVYRVHHLDLDADRAVRVVSQSMLGPDSGQWAECYNLFQLEAQLAAQVEDENVLRVYDFQQAEDRLYLVMEFAGGGSLARRLQDGPLPVEQAVSIARDAAAGLKALHKQRVVHCHVTPSSILLDAWGQAKIADLGGAQSPWNSGYRTTEDRSAQSFLPYQSPEQAQGVAYLTPSSDVYSLGCVLFEMLTGQRWSNARAAEQTPRDLRPELSPQLEAVLARMLREERGRKPGDASDARKRYPTMGDVLAALPASLPLTTTPSPRKQGTQAAQPARKGARVLPLVVLIALIGVAGLFWYGTGGESLDQMPAWEEVLKNAATMPITGELVAKIVNEFDFNEDRIVARKKAIGKTTTAAKQYKPILVVIDKVLALKKANMTVKRLTTAMEKIREMVSSLK